MPFLKCVLVTFILIQLHTMMEEKGNWGGGAEEEEEDQE